MNVSGIFNYNTNIYINTLKIRGVTCRGVAGQTGEVDGVELNVVIRVYEEAGGVVSQVQPLTHHHHHHPQPRPPGRGLHTAGLPRVQEG